MQFTITQTPKYWKISIDGRFVAATAESIHDNFDETKLDQMPFVLFDLEKMTHIDSMGLGTLVKILQQCKSKGGIARIVHLQPHPRIVFDITKVYRVFEIFDTLEEADRQYVN